MAHDYTDSERAAYLAGIQQSRKMAAALSALDGQTLGGFVQMLDILIAAAEAHNEPS